MKEFQKSVVDERSCSVSHASCGKTKHVTKTPCSNRFDVALLSIKLTMQEHLAECTERCCYASFMASRQVYLLDPRLNITSGVWS